MRLTSGSSVFQVTRSGKVTVGTLSAEFPELADFTSVAGNGNTPALTVFPHAVWLVAAV